MWEHRRIFAMEQGDQAFIDLVVPGYITFREDHLGEFQFGAVHGDLDYRLAPYQETERLEFSWEGENEMDQVSGRGWAIIEDGQLQGRLYLHEGDASGVTAEKRDAQRGGGRHPCHQHLKAATQTLTRYGGKPTRSHGQPMRMCLPGLNDSAAVSMSTSPSSPAIIGREHDGEREILVQTRWKPDRDPLYAGTLEVPAGGMHVYENVYDAVKREVLEETGLRCELLSRYPHEDVCAQR